MAISTYPEGAPFAGVIGRTTDTSSPAWPAPRRAPEGSPNVVFFVLDDVGFGQLSAFGGLVDTPVLDCARRTTGCATRTCTPPRCAPRRAACVLTGRNHHSVGMASHHRDGHRLSRLQRR